jgi:hypothetical protein
MAPLLVSRRSGRTIALVVALGFGGGTILLGVTSAAAGALKAAAIWPAFWGYFWAAMPFFVFGAILAACRRELWVVPEQQMLKMLTYRPWLVRGPRVEQAPLTEYRGLCLVSLEARAEQASLAVALVPTEGDPVPLREFESAEQAESFLAEMEEATGLPRVRAETSDDDAA